jgi:aspartyl-tRNA(Asn)/glutamyl-tRNA(Gln) amidotransferase subunit B
MGPLRSYLNERAIHFADFSLKPKQIADIIQLIDENKISNSAAAQRLFP